MLKFIILFAVLRLSLSDFDFTGAIEKARKMYNDTIKARLDRSVCQQELRKCREVDIVSMHPSCQPSIRQLQNFKQEMENKQLQLKLLQLSSKEDLTKCAEQKLKDKKQLEQNLRASIQRSQNYLLGLSDYTYEEERNFKIVKEKFDREINRLFEDKGEIQKLNEEDRLQIKKLKEQKVVLQVKLSQRSPQQASLQKLKQDNELLTSRNRELNSRIDKVETQLAASKNVIKNFNGADGISALIEENRKLKMVNMEFKIIVRDIYDITKTQQ